MPTVINALTPILVSTAQAVSYKRVLVLLHATQIDTLPTDNVNYVTMLVPPAQMEPAHLAQLVQLDSSNTLPTNVLELAQQDTLEITEFAPHVQVDALHAQMPIPATLVLADRISRELFAKPHAITDTSALEEFARNVPQDAQHAQLLINANHAQMDSS